MVVHAKPPLQPLQKSKLLVKGDATVGSLIVLLRPHLAPTLKPPDAVFLFAADSTIPPNSMLIAALHAQHHQHGILHVTVRLESAFG